MNYSAKAPSSSFQPFPGDEAKSTPLARKRRIGFFGFFGSGNSGNDGSLETMLRRVREVFPDAEILCVCAEPAKVGPRLAVNCVRINWRPQSAALQKLDRWLFNIPREIATLIHGVRHLRKLDALIIPGTGILDDFCTGPRGMPYWLFRWSLLARLTGTRVAFVSIGAGPIHHPLSRWLMKKAAGMASYRSYRDRYSLGYMRDIGSNVVADRVFPDIAFALPEPLGVREPSAAGEPITVAVGIMYYNGWRGGEDGRQIYKDYLDKMKRFIDWLLQNGHGVRIIMGDGVDLETFEFFTATTEVSSKRRLTGTPAQTLHDVMTQIAETDVVVATRYHNVVCALKLGRPTLSIGYATKNDELMAEMGLGEFCQHIERLDVDMLITQFCKLADGRKFYESRIRDTVARCKDRLREQENFLFSSYMREGGGRD
jgi:polysaccharide pyruvyl transferase WcaK-like protein